MLKLVRVPFSDITFDPEAVGEMLTGCLQRHRKMRFAGAGATDDTLVVMFEETPFRSGSKLVLAPFRSDDPEELCAEISERYEHGFTLRSSFRIRNRSWALYEVEGE